MAFYANWSFWLYAFAFAAFASCLTAYGLRSPWWRSSTGRAMFTLYAALTAVLGLVLVAYVGWIPEEFRDVFRVLTIGAITVAGWVQFANIVRLQPRRRRCRERVDH